MRPILKQLIRLSKHTEALDSALQSFSRWVWRCAQSRCQTDTGALVWPEGTRACPLDPANDVPHRGTAPSLAISSRLRTKSSEMRISLSQETAPMAAKATRSLDGPKQLGVRGCHGSNEL